MYSYFGPAHMTGHAVSVQNSAMMPYSRLLRHSATQGVSRRQARRPRGDSGAHISLKKSTVLTASHSFTSSPSGSVTASCKLPAPSVACAYLCSSYRFVPALWWRRGRKVFPLSRPAKPLNISVVAAFGLRPTACGLRSAVSASISGRCQRGALWGITGHVSFTPARSLALITTVARYVSRHFKV